MQELLAIESVARRDQEKPFGNGVAQALDYTLSLCQRMGFHTKNADGLYGYAEIGEGAEIIGCLGHLDVVPAGDGWHYPPYAGTIDGGKMRPRQHALAMPRSTSVVVKPLPSNRRSFSANGSFAVPSSFISR